MAGIDPVMQKYMMMIKQQKQDQPAAVKVRKHTSFYCCVHKFLHDFISENRSVAVDIILWDI